VAEVAAGWYGFFIKGTFMSDRDASYLMVEAVNIEAAVFDTSQLSIIRGGSYLLTRAIIAVAAHPRYEKQLRTLSIGASSGLFLVENGEQADELSDQIAHWLSNHHRYRYFTFVVEVCTADSLGHAREILLAKLRFRQLRHISMVPDPGPSPQAADPGPCGVDGCRIADGKVAIRLNEQPVKVSASVRERLYQGRRLRSGLYLRLLQRNLHQQEDQRLLLDIRKRLHNVGFSDDLQTLAACDRFDKLNNKMAVIYLDGNGFGAIQRRQATTVAGQIAFDEGLRQLRARLLADLLAPLIPDHDADGHSEWCEACVPASSRKERAMLRFEILLWGGDEMTLVVPAWLGFDLLQRFYAHSHDWILGEPLTHAGGIVFCQAKTPIGTVRQLAQRLAEDIKESHYQGRSGNWFDYLVLESIDYPVEKELQQFHQRRYGGIVDQRQPMAPSTDWFAVAKPAALRLLGDGHSDGALSRSGVFALARRIHSEAATGLFGDRDEGPPPWETAEAVNAPSPFEQAERRLLELSKQRYDGDAKQIDADLATLAGVFGAAGRELRQRAWLWLHLSELWDYLVPERDYRAAGARS
jgi:hypothetical protein